MLSNVQWQLETSKKISQAIAKAWLDPDGFGKMFMKNTKGVLEEEGVVFPLGITIQTDLNTCCLEIQEQGTIFSIPLLSEPPSVTTEELRFWTHKEVDCIPLCGC